MKKKENNLKIFVLDTNIILTDHNTPFDLAKDHQVVIPMGVIQELDTFKSNDGLLGYHARQFSNKILQKTPVINSEDTTALIEISTNIFVVDYGYSNIPVDDQIIYTANSLKDTCPDVKLLSNDNNVVIKAIAYGVRAERLKQTKQESFSGVSKVILPEDRVQEYFGKQKFILTTEESVDLNPMQVVILRSEDESSSSLGFHLFTDVNEPLINMKGDISLLGNIKPKNKEQTWLMNLGLQLGKKAKNPIDLLTIEGPAGSGKTLLAVAIAMHLIEEGDYNSVTLTKPVAAMGEQNVGFLKGGYAEKIAPFMQSYVDILDKLGYADMGMMMDETKEKFSSKKDNKSRVKFDALTYIRGRNLSDIIILDEAQSLTKHEIKTLITRADEGAKIILIADTEQIDVSYVNKYNNGFTHAVNELQGLGFTAHIRLLKSERSRLAEAAGKLL